MAKFTPIEAQEETLVSKKNAKLHWTNQFAGMSSCVLRQRCYWDYVQYFLAGSNIFEFIIHVWAAASDSVVVVFITKIFATLLVVCLNIFFFFSVLLCWKQINFLCVLHFAMLWWWWKCSTIWQMWQILYRTGIDIDID